MHRRIFQQSAHNISVRFRCCGFCDMISVNSTKDHGAIIKIDLSPVNANGVSLDVKGQIKTVSYSGIFHL